MAGRRRGRPAEGEEVGRRQSRERPGPAWAGKTLGPGPWQEGTCAACFTHPGPQRSLLYPLWLRGV